MDIKHYLAMTAVEFSNEYEKVSNPAWMACHFSPYGNGLTNLPNSLPLDSMIIINDITPPNGHEPQKIVKQLNELGERLHTELFLLDFQRKFNIETQTIATILVEELHGKVAVTEIYAKDLDCPVFLTCPRPHQALKETMKPWENREIWLEVGTEAEIFTVTTDNSNIELLQEHMSEENELSDNILHCRYSTKVFENHATVILERTVTELNDLMTEASCAGVKIAVGLYQQFK